jgi:excisionase family DNA binding protein
MTKLSVTIPEAAMMLGIKRSSVYKLFRQRKLTPLKMGSRTLVTVAELDALVKSLPVADIAEAA